MSNELSKEVISKVVNFIFVRPLCVKLESFFVKKDIILSAGFYIDSALYFTRKQLQYMDF